MNLPNKLTVLRVLMIPFFVVFMITPLAEGNGKYIALALFCIASLTDMLDGKIARKHNLVTNFGKFKTVSHMAMIILLILDIQNPIMQTITTVVVWIGLILTVVSLLDYIVKNKQVLTQGGM